LGGWPSILPYPPWKRAIFWLYHTVCWQSFCRLSFLTSCWFRQVNRFVECDQLLVYSILPFLTKKFMVLFCLSLRLNLAMLVMRGLASLSLLLLLSSSQTIWICFLLIDIVNFLFL
jgi:hypothetical protein